MAEPARARFFPELTHALRHPLSRTSALTLVEGAVLSVAVVCALYAAVFQTLFLRPGVLLVSVAAPCLAIFATSRGLRSQGLGFERLFVGLTAAVSGLWLFEILYHYGYAGSLDAIGTNLLTLGLDTGTGNYFPLPWAILMVALPAVAYKRMGLSVLFVLLIMATLLAFWQWESAAYIQFAFATGPTAIRAAEYNSVAKLFVCLVPASLFVGAGPAGRIDGADPSTIPVGVDPEAHRSY